jgi:hypothetical protein
LEVTCQIHVTATLLPKKDPWCPLAKNAGWAPELVSTLGEEKKILASAGNRNPIIKPDANIIITCNVNFLVLNQIAD